MPEVLVHTEGLISGARVSVDLIVDRIVISWPNGQSPDREIPIARIEAIQSGKLGKVPFIRFITAGMNPEVNSWQVLRGDSDSILFDLPQQLSFEQIRNYILQRIEGKTATFIPTQGTTPELTQHERRRIYDEEKARIEARAQIERERHEPTARVARYLVFVWLAALLFAAAVRSLGPPELRGLATLAVIVFAILVIYEANQAAKGVGP